MWIVEIYDAYKPWMEEYTCKVVNGPYGDYYRLKVSENEKAVVGKKIVHKKHKWYRANFSRSSDYRKKFFEENKDPYYCRYCHHPLTKEELEVDHIVPVAKMKSKTDYRNYLYLLGAKNINDPKNLAPSCHRCNQKKGDKLGLWYLKGVLGKFDWYWIAKKIMRIVISIAIISIILGIYYTKL